MSSKSLALGASVLALSLASISYAKAQASLPTINVGGNKAKRASNKPATNPNSGRTTAVPMITAMTSGQGNGVGVGTPGLSDRYAEPKPAPFSRTLPANIPAVVASRTRAEINNSVNFVTMADAFKYLPSIYVRERFPGDTNGIVSGRTTGLLESANTMVYADNILLSNYLGNGFAYPPRWGMVAPEEIERIDVIYGPFSALYPGNSVGGVLTMTTRMPEQFEIHARGLGAGQRYSQYSYSDTPLTGNINVLVGNKFGDSFRVFANYNHLDSTSQPMQYANNALLPTDTAGFGSGSTAGSWSNSNTQGPQFSGGNFLWNQYGFPGMVTAATSITHTVQDLGKVKASYDIDKDTRVYVQSAFWNNMQDSNVQSFIRDRNGVPIYNTQSGDVQIWGPRVGPGGTNSAPGGYSVTPGGVNPGHAGSQHIMNTLQLKRDSGKEFDYDISVSQYNYLRDFSNSANAYGLLPNNTASNARLNGAGDYYSTYAAGVGRYCNSPSPTTAQARWSTDCGSSPYGYLINPTGQNTNSSGQYWRTGDARFIYRPDMDAYGKHEISFGGHSDKYSLNTTQTQTAMYPSNYQFGIRQYNTGQTSMHGGYVQDAWKVNDQLKFIGGLRGDWWSAYNGQNTTGGWSPSNGNAAGFVQNSTTFAITNPGQPPFVNITGSTATRTNFPNSNKAGFQPKASVEYKINDNWETRGSFGRAYRFPTPAELFQSLTTPNQATVNNPNLQPQVSSSYDYTNSWRFVDPMGGIVGLVNPRVSFFWEDRWNAIINQQTVNTLGQASTQVMNVNKARMRGIEAELLMKDIFVEGLAFSGNITLTDAKIVNNNTVLAYNQLVPLWNTGKGIAPFLSNYYPNFGVSGGFVNGYQYPGIPPLKIKSVITYSPTKEWDFAFGARYLAPAFTTYNNIDWNHNSGPGSQSAMLVFDTKINWRFEKNWTANFGVNNIGNYRSWVGPHPNPQRMFFAGVNYDFGGPEDSLKAGSQQQTAAFQ
jgi:iron complex outermembrane receptor protein